MGNDLISGDGGLDTVGRAESGAYALAVLTGGIVRRNLAVRWVGLVILLATTAKVFLFDMARLEGVIRAASFLALGALLVGGALISRKLRDGLGLSFGRKDPPDG